MNENFQDMRFEAIAMAIGQLTLAWNDLHETIAHVFWGLIDCSNDTSARMAIAVWHSSKVDRACRQMLLSVLDHLDEVFLKANPSAAKDIRWLLSRVDELEEARNNAIHAPLKSIMLFNTDMPVTSVASRITYRIEADATWGNKRAEKLADRKDLLAEFHWCRDNVLVLRDYADAMADVIIASTGSTWPNKPTLPNRGHKCRE